jgi:glycosyltransferase involved in cell wall biosynthesis
MKKVIVFTGTYLPGFKAGGPIQSLKNMVLALKKDVKFKIVTMDRDWNEKMPYENIKIGIWNEVLGAEVLYLTPKEFFSKDKIKEILLTEEYDYVYTNGSFSDYTLKIMMIKLCGKLKGKKIIVAPRGEYSGKALELKATKKQLFLRLANLIGIYKDIIWHATTEEEAIEIKKNHKYGTIRVASNLKEKLEVEKVNNKKENTLNLVFISRISPKKNLLKCLTLLKNFDKKNITFDIYGPIEDEDYWKACQIIIRKLKNVVVNYKGFIKQEEVVKTLGKYDFLFFPTMGENFGHIILESFFAKTPVILSDQTPWKELEKKGIGWDITLEEDNKYLRVIDLCHKMTEETYENYIEKIKNFNNTYSTKTSVLKYLEMFNAKI